MQTNIYFIRHGEVENPQGIIYGRLPNFGLSENGKKELEKTADFLLDKQITILYSSPLQRTKESAAIVQKKLQIPTIHITDVITETLSSYQGRKFRDLDKLQSEVYLKPLSPSDETIQQLAVRMKHFLQFLIKTYPGKNIAVLSHGDPIMALKAVVKNKSLSFYAFKTDKYIQHGEVYKIKAEAHKLIFTSVFKPQI